jgi:site-specific DNA recombinase
MVLSSGDCCNAPPVVVAMTPSFATKNQKVRYRYYTCVKAQKLGWATCPSKSISAGQMEQFVIERIKSISSDPRLQQEVMEILNSHHEEEREALVSEEGLLDREIKRWTQEAKNLVGQIKADDVNTIVTSRLAQVKERLAQETPRLAHVRQELARLHEWAIPTETVVRALERFDLLWQAMNMHERQKLLHLLIERIDYDGKQGSVTIIFRPSGLESLLTESQAPKETAA